MAEDTVLVTGGAGFIGSHVVDALIERGYQVAVLDLLSTGSSSNLHPQTTLYEGDITDAATVERVFSEVGPAFVSHQAAQISVSESTKDPAGDARTNVVGSLVVLEACRRHGVRHVTFASSGGALYGNAALLPAPETAAIRPLSPYGAAKRAVEVYLGTYQDTWGLKSASLRYANTYGPRQSPDGEAGVIAIFAGKMLAGETPTIFGDGTQERDYVYVGDVVSANLLAMERELAGAYNVGTGVGTPVGDIATQLASLCGYAGPVERAAERPGDVARISIDSSLLTGLTGWRAELSMADGLQRVVEHIKAGRAR